MLPTKFMQINPYFQWSGAAGLCRHAVNYILQFWTYPVTLPLQHPPPPPSSFHQLAHIKGWVAKVGDGWIREWYGWLSAHLLQQHSGCEPWASLKTHKWATKAKEWPTHSSPPKKILKTLLQTALYSKGTWVRGRSRKASPKTLSPQVVFRAGHFSPATKLKTQKMYILFIN
jgi:hypothetical protein